MRILTFNWHEAYVSTLAKTGHAFDVVERMKGGSRAWFYETRPLPPNARVVREATAREGLRRHGYDVLICHNVKDVLWARDLDVPKVLVLHNQLSTEIALGGWSVDAAAHRAEVQRVVDDTAHLRIVCISERKRADWDVDAVVITPGIDLADYDGYTGADARVLRVGNFMKARDVMLGYQDQLRILKGQPSTLLGLNEPEPGAESRFSRSWDDLKQCFRSHRVFLNTTVEGYEDGYNLAMLEAMATGMPIVSTPNQSSPIENGVNGFVSADREWLGEQIAVLLADQPLAERLGQAARQTVARRFAMADFVAKWNRVFDETAALARRPVQVSVGAPDPPARPAPSRTRVLLSYVSYPATTARYLEDSLRRSHDVVTTGPAMSESLRQAWNLQNMKEAIRPHDIPAANETDVSAVVDQLAAQWTPDLYLWVESVHGHFPRGIPRLGCPTACYLIDSHMNLSWHLEWARHFDHVFVAQREYIPEFLAAGCGHVEWLPLGCDPVMHGPAAGPKRYDVGFVGSLTGHHQRRQRLLGQLRRRFHVHVERAFLREMAATLSASRLVFNDAVRRDLNMRVFETLCAGSLLLTDRAEPSGLDELFTDREHLVIWDDETLEDLVEYYLTHEDERERIAAAGRAHVLARHTYDHRTAYLLEASLGGGVRPGATTVQGRTIQDPLVQDALALAGRGQDAEALARLALIDDARELSGWEWFTAHEAASGLLHRQGRHDEADARQLAALAALPPEDRARLRTATL
ncbi:MAG: glycosyltransferase [Vicinamibacterales bacterium]|nr:glycosyltransferase [Vicinamibacterales bacterium]